MRIAILASGRGSNAKALLEAERENKLGKSKIVLLISDIADAPALDIAKDFGVENIHIQTNVKGVRFTPESTKKYIDALKNAKVDFVVLAGFMKIVPDEFIAAYEGKMINLHPSLLPAYKGKDSIARAFEAGEKFSGCSVHFVSAQLDGGEIIDQSPVEILSCDTLDSLEEKVHAAEHKLLTKVVKNFADNFAIKNA